MPARWSALSADSTVIIPLLALALSRPSCPAFVRSSFRCRAAVTLRQYSGDCITPSAAIRARFSSDIGKVSGGVGSGAGGMICEASHDILASAGSCRPRCKSAKVSTLVNSQCVLSTKLAQSPPQTPPISRHMRPAVAKKAGSFHSRPRMF